MVWVGAMVVSMAPRFAAGRPTPCQGRASRRREGLSVRRYSVGVRLISMFHWPFWTTLSSWLRTSIS
jgi:hypothetical protein